MSLETRFHAEDGGFGARAAVVADASLPSLATVFADVANRFITVDIDGVPTGSCTVCVQGKVVTALLLQTSINL
jgi:hypothetical protein